MELKRIRIGSCWKVMPLLFLGLGFLVGGFSLLTLSALPGQPPGMMSIGFFGGLFATVIYAVFFAVISAGMLVIAALIYNLLASKLGGIVIDTRQ